MLSDSSLVSSDRVCRVTGVFASNVAELFIYLHKRDGFVTAILVALCVSYLCDTASYSAFCRGQLFV